VPVLARAGDSFASRVSASLLHSLGLEGLVTGSGQEYEDRAVALANDPAQLAPWRERLARNRDAASAFDPAALARDLEALYRRMVARHQSGLSPEALAL
jgi:protein O-GlcNAc transferase